MHSTLPSYRNLPTRANLIITQTSVTQQVFPMFQSAKGFACEMAFWSITGAQSTEQNQVL
jgi:hypothetical protein